MHRFSTNVAILLDTDNLKTESSYFNVIIRTEANEFCSNFDKNYFHIATRNDGYSEIC